MESILALSLIRDMYIKSNKMPPLTKVVNIFKKTNQSNVGEEGGKNCVSCIAGRNV